MSSLTLRRFLLPVALLPVLAVGGSASAERVTKYPVGGLYPTPIEIVTGPDGNLWFADRYAASVSRMTPDGAVSRVNVGTATPGPFGVAVGPDGNIWFTESTGNRIGKIELKTITQSGPNETLFPHVVEYEVPTAGAYPTVITAGPDGNMWFVELLAHKIGRITPQGSVTEFETPTKESFPKAITAGSDGALWFVESEVDRIGRITVDGAITEFKLPHDYSSPYRITSGPDGALWFTEYLGDRLGRITTAGAITEIYLGKGAFPRGVTTGPDGALYVTMGSDSNKRVGRFETNGSARDIRIPQLSEERPIPGYDFTPSKSGNLQGITVGPDGNIWFTENDTGKVGKIEIDGHGIATEAAPSRR